MARNRVEVLVEETEEIIPSCFSENCLTKEIGEIMSCRDGQNPENQTACFNCSQLQKAYQSRRSIIHHDGVVGKRDPDYGRFGLPNSPGFLLEDLI